MGTARVRFLSCIIVTALWSTALGYGDTPQKDKQIEVISTIRSERPAAGVPPQEDKASSYLDLLERGFAYIGDIFYGDRRRGAKADAVRQATLAEAQKNGGQIVRLTVGESSDTVMTPAYTRVFTDGHRTTTWSSSGGMKFKRYLYGFAEVYASDQDLASQQLQILEKRRAEHNEKRAMLLEKIKNAEKARNEFESAHPADKNEPVAAFIHVLRSMMEEANPPLKRLNEMMHMALDDVRDYLKQEEGAGCQVNYLSCGDRRAHLEALCAAASCLNEIQEALAVDLNNPHSVLGLKR